MTEETKTKKPGEKWSDAEVSQLRELLGKATAAQIGARIGRTKSGVLKKVRSLGLQNPQIDKTEKWSEPLIEKLKTLGPTMTAKAFREKYGLAKDSVYNHAKKFKIKFLLEPRTPKKKNPVGDGKRVTKAMPAERKRYAKKEPCRIEWCSTCGSPVSNWQEHFERLGHRRQVL